MAIYQARFLKYLEGRGLAKTADRKVWAFLGDGECDGIAGRDLDGGTREAGQPDSSSTATCSGSTARPWQRQDHPGLEGVFRGAGWNVIKVVGVGLGQAAKDQAGILLRRMEECVDGQYQDFKSRTAHMC
jgi:pyruvate dehydrogenase E1 component